MMASGLLPHPEMQDSPTAAATTTTTGDTLSLAEALAIAPDPEPPPAYLTRLASLPERIESPHTESRPQPARLDHIEHALTILASVVARLAKEAQHSRHQLRSTEHDASLQEERRVQRELVRSMQARLDHMEDRLERQQLQAPIATTQVAEQLSGSLNAIRESLAALAKRRQRREAQT